MVTIHNNSLKNKTLTTDSGEYWFDADGNSSVPDELAQRLLLINGFYIVEGEIKNPDVTLEGGIVWHPIAGGYIVSSSVVTYTITGSAFDDEPVPPSNATLDANSNNLTFSETIDTANVHVRGVVPNETIQIGNSVYRWSNLDNNTANGYELDLVGSLIPGGTYTTIDGGYVLNENITLVGADINQVTLEGDKLIYSDDVNPSEIHVDGVPEGDTVSIGDTNYIYKDTDSDIPGLELLELHSITGSDNVYTEEGSKYILTNGTDSVTLSAPPTDLVLADGQISISPNADLSTIHVEGVQEGDTLLVGDTEYIWQDTNPSIDGLELVEKNPAIALPTGGTYTTIEGGYILTDGKETYTLNFGNLDVTKFGVSDGKLLISEGADTLNTHVQGVQEGDTISIGTDVYIWQDTNPAVAGLELVYIVPTGWETIEGGYIYDLNGVKYTLTGSAFGTEEIPEHVNVVDQKLTFSSDIDIPNVHVQGVQEGDTIKIGPDTYEWKELDPAIDGLELSYVVPVYTLPSGDTYSPTENGFILTNGDVAYTLVGDSVDEGVYIDKSTNKLAFTDQADLSAIHALGTQEGDTLLIGDTKYIWRDTNPSIDGLELTLENPPITLSGGGTYTTVEGGYELTDGLGTYTVLANSPEILDYLGVQEGKLNIAEGVDTDNLHVEGVQEGDIVYIGGVSYIWQDEDVETPGIEIIEKNPAIPLTWGGTYTTIEGGYLLTDGKETYTLRADSPNDFGVDGKTIIIGPSVNLDNVHVEGVTSGQEVLIKGEVYIWKDTDKSVPGLELNRVYSNIYGNSYILDNGNYIITNGNATYTLLGSDTPIDSIHIDTDNKLAYSEDIDVSKIHVLGVQAEDSIKIGTSVYKYLEYDLQDGYELIQISKDGWTSINGGYIYEDKYILTGGAFKSDSIIPANVTIDADNNLVLAGNINVNQVHVLGVTPDSTIKIGNTDYVWKDTNDNEFDGLELVEIHTLPSGDTYTQDGDKYILTNGTVSYTISGDNPDLDNIFISEDKPAYNSGFDPSSIHILGVKEGDTVDVMGSTYEYKNTDGITSNGYELVIKSIDGWEKGANGYEYHDGDMNYTIQGSAFNSDSPKPNNVKIDPPNIVFPNPIDVSDVHAQGVTPNSTVQVGDTTYFWYNSDWNSANGLELVEIHTLPSGDTYHILNNKVVITNGVVNYTLIGSSIDEPNTFINSDNKLTFTDKADLSTVHAVGVSNGDTLAIGDTVYRWEDLDDRDNGLELNAISKLGWQTIEGGYVYNGDVSYTLLGSAFDSGDLVPANVTLANDQLILDNQIDVSKVHVQGVIPNSSIQVGDSSYYWKDTDTAVDGLELVKFEALPLGGTYFKSEDGFILTDGQAQYTVLGDTLDTEHVGIVGGALILREGLDISNFYVYGVAKGETILIGDGKYSWENDPEHPGYTPVDTNPPIPLSNGTYTTIESGYVLTDGTVNYTLVSAEIDPDNIGVKDGELLLGEATNPDTIHVLGVQPNDTIYIGDEGFRWEDKDNIVTNGYELVMVNPPISLPGGGTYTTIEGGYILTDGQVSYTLYASEIDKDNIAIVDSHISLGSGIDTSKIHLLGAKEDDSIQVGNDIYFWEETSGTLADGFELVKAKEVDGFTIDWDNRKVTVEGGMKPNLTDEDIALGTNLDGNQLTLNGIIENSDEVHIIGMSAMDTIKTDSGNYTLMDTDNNLDNGLELVGSMDDTPDWKYSNRSRPSEEQIWRHYFNEEVDIKVKGVTCRPSYNKRLLTLIGDEISEITNSTNYILTISGNVKGILYPGVSFKGNSIIDSQDTGSYIIRGDTLFIKNGSLSGIYGDFDFTLDKGYLTIVKGALSVENSVVTGTAITKVNYTNKEFIVVKGKLARNAITRNTIKRKP